MEDGNVSGNGTALGEHHTPVQGGDDHGVWSNRLGSSASSSSSDSSEDPFQLDEDESGNAKASLVGQLEHKNSNGNGSTSGCSEDDFPDSSMPDAVSSPNGLPEQSSVPSDANHDDELGLINGSAKQLPPVQVMERPSDAGSPSPYRIPSSVFRRNKSTAPMEWSTASNESLFSIHMGNMSFTKDPLFWIGKSGELGKPGEEIMHPWLTDYTNAPSPATDKDKTNNNVDSAPSTPSLTPLAVDGSRESTEHNKNNCPWPNMQSCHPTSPSHRSDASGGSVKSFAFPILTGDGDKSGSLKVAGSGAKNHPMFTHSKSEPQVDPKPQTPKAQTPKAAPEKDQTGWLSCFSCCTFCS